MKNDYEVRGEITAIFLKRKDGTVLETLIDTNDLLSMEKYPDTWCPWWNKCTQSFYVQGHLRLGVNVKTKIYLHRYLTDAPKGKFVDHKDNDTLNNCRGNFRILTNGENQQNRKSKPSNNKSGIQGVSWSERNGKWQCHIRFEGKTMYLGLHESLDVAKKVVEDARKLNMPYSKLTLAN